MVPHGRSQPACGAAGAPGEPPAQQPVRNGCCSACCCSPLLQHVQPSAAVSCSSMHVALRLLHVAAACRRLVGAVNLLIELPAPSPAAAHLLCPPCVICRPAGRRLPSPCVWKFLMKRRQQQPSRHVQPLRPPAQQPQPRRCAARPAAAAAAAAMQTLRCRLALGMQGRRHSCRCSRLVRMRRQRRRQRQPRQQPMVSNTWPTTTGPCPWIPPCWQRPPARPAGTAGKAAWMPQRWQRCRAAAR